MCLLSRGVVSNLVVVAALRTTVSESERRLGSPITRRHQSEQDLEEASLFWNRLLQSTGSSIPLSPSVAPTSNRMFLGIGDSLCNGQLPEPKNEIFVSDEGYTDNLFSYLESRDDIDTLLKICCPAKDSHEIINGTYDQPISDGSFCYGKAGQLPSQLEAAVQTIRNNNVDFITISVGGNDLFPCVDADDPEACSTLRIEQLVANLAVIVPMILEAVGTDAAPIIAMTPYNPILSYSLSEDPAERVLVPFSQQVVLALHAAVTTNVYEPLGIPVVPAFDVFDGLNDTLTSDGVPQNVVSVCDYTGMCRKTEGGDYALNDPLIRDIHPTPDGYERLANAHIRFVEQLELVQP